MVGSTRDLVAARGVLIGLVAYGATLQPTGCANGVLGFHRSLSWRASLLIDDPRNIDGAMPRTGRVPRKCLCDVEPMTVHTVQYF